MRSATRRSATRRWLTTATALLTALFAVLGVAVPAQAHEGVNVTLFTDGSGGVWGVVTYADGHPVTGPINAIMLAVSPDDPNKRVGPVSLTAPEGQTDGTVRYGGVLEPGPWQVNLDVASPGIAACSFTITAAAAGSAPTPAQQACAASFWPTPAPESAESGGTSLVVAVIAVGAVLLAAALWIAMRARRDRPGGGGPGGGRSGGRGPSGGRPSGGSGRERTGATQGRSRSR
jgi:hypothetical protein